MSSRGYNLTAGQPWLAESLKSGLLEIDLHPSFTWHTYTYIQYHVFTSMLF